MTRLTAAQARKLGILPNKRQRTIASRVQWDAKLIPGGVWLQIPEIPPSLNVWSRWHWAKRKRYLDQLSRNIGQLALATKLPRFERATVQVLYYFRDKRLRDKDNYSGKFILDALRYGGVIAEDNSEVLSLPEPGFEVDQGRPRVEVFIWGRD